jgi:two-component SAPR family response regulator
MAQPPDYRLQVLFNLREKAKTEAEEFYAEKKKKVAEEQRKLDDMKQHLRDMVGFREQKKIEYTEKMRGGAMTIHAIQANDRHIDKLKLEEQAFQIEIVRQGERLNEAQAEANDAMQAMLKATQDYKALEKHKEKWQKQIKRELTLKEEDAAEDIAQAQYFQKMLAGRSDE